MKVAAFTQLGGPEHVEPREFPDPDPDDDQALLSVAASSVNRHDLWFLEGSRYLKERHLPFVSGVDLAGEVVDVGADVEGVAPGDRVVFWPTQTCGECQYCYEGPENLCEEYSLFHGGFAERAAVDAHRLVPLPDGVDYETAATLPVAYVTAWHMLRRADVRAGDTVLVPGATGGVGVAAVQLCNVLGATPIGTSSSAEKLDRLRSVADCETIHSGEAADVAAAVDDEYGEVDAVMNHLAGPFTDAGLSVLRRGGTMVICGRTAGKQTSFDSQDLFLGHKRIVGSTMGTQQDLARLVTLLDEGAFEPPIFDTYSLDEVDRAFADMKDRTVFGKLVITP